jgi:hypothetical protein
VSFQIKNIVGCDLSTIQWHLQQNLRESRFTADVRTDWKKITIHQVRLNAAKPYCGNHPYPCPVNPFGFERPHRKGKWLEGADWVAFNDLVNDVLDDLGVSADVASSVVRLRKGRERCVRYEGYSRGFGGAYEWVKDSGCFADMIGKPHEISEYPDGTPGYAVWKAEEIPLKEARSAHH